jgi:hypothetical protein
MEQQKVVFVVNGAWVSKPVMYKLSDAIRSALEALAYGETDSKKVLGHLLTKKLEKDIVIKNSSYTLPSADIALIDIETKQLSVNVFYETMTVNIDPNVPKVTIVVSGSKRVIISQAYDTERQLVDYIEKVALRVTNAKTKTKEVKENKESSGAKLSGGRGFKIKFVEPHSAPPAEPIEESPSEEEALPEAENSLGESSEEAVDVAFPVKPLEASIEENVQWRVEEDDVPAILDDEDIKQLVSSVDGAEE